MARRSFRGSSVATTLTGSISLSDTAITVVDGSSLPTGVAPFVMTLDFGFASEEKVLVTTRTGNILSPVTRAFDGTTATSHASGATARHTISATDLDEANAHVNLPVDTQATDIHHTLGTGAFQAATGTHAHLINKYTLLLTPPSLTNTTVTTSSGNTTNTTQDALVLTATAVNGAYAVATRGITGSYVTAGFIKTGIVDVSVRMHLSAITDATNQMFVGLGDTNPPVATTSANGAWLIVKGDGTVSTNKRVASASTAGTTTAANASATVIRDYRITYPLAGGTATVYVDGVSVGTITTVPALAISVFVTFGVTTTATAISGVFAQFLVTEG